MANKFIYIQSSDNFWPQQFSSRRMSTEIMDRSDDEWSDQLYTESKPQSADRRRLTASAPYPSRFSARRGELAPKLTRSRDNANSKMRQTSDLAGRALKARENTNAASKLVKKSQNSARTSMDRLKMLIARRQRNTK